MPNTSIKSQEKRWKLKKKKYIARRVRNKRKKRIINRKKRKYRGQGIKKMKRSRERMDKWRKKKWKDEKGWKVDEDRKREE